MAERPSLAKNTSFLALAQLIRVAAQALYLIAVRRHLSTAEFGAFSVAFVMAKLVTQFAELGFSTTLLRDASRNRAELRQVLGSALGLRGATSAGVLLVLIVLSLALPYPRAAAWATLLFGLSYLIQSFTQLFFSALRSHEKVHYEPLALLTYAFLLLGGTWLAIAQGGGLVAIASAAVLAQAGSMGFILLASLSALKGEVALAWNGPLLRRFWRSCWPIGAGTIGYLIYYQADTVMLYFMRSDVETGVYNTAYQLVAVSLILPVSYFTALMPRLVGALEGDLPLARRLMETSSRIMLGLGLPLAVGTGIVAGPLLRWLFPEAGTESVLPLQLLIWLAAISYWGQTFTNAAVVLDQGRIYMRLSLLGGVVNVIANLLVIPRYGYLGACFTTLGTELLINGLFYASVVRRTGTVAFLAPLGRPLGATLAMAAVLSLAGSLPLPVLILLGAGVYGLALAALGGLRGLRE